MDETIWKGRPQKKLRSDKIFMPKIQHTPTYAQCVIDLLQAASEPMSVDALLDAVAELRPVGTGGRVAVVKALNAHYQTVPVAKDCYGWLPNLLRDNVVRHPLTEREIRRGYLMLDELEHAVFFPEFFQQQRAIERNLTIHLLDGPTIHAAAYIERRVWSLRLGHEFSEWVDQRGGNGQDAIVIRVDDAAAGVYTLRLQPREARDAQAIQQRNIDLALCAESIVSDNEAEYLAAWQLVAQLIARGAYADPVPPDELHYALHHFSVLKFVEGIGYAMTDDIPNELERRLRTNESHSRPDSVVDSALRFLGWSSEQGKGDSVHDWLDAMQKSESSDAGSRNDSPREGDRRDNRDEHGDFNDVDSYALFDTYMGGDDEDEVCTAYLRYLERIVDSEMDVEPVSHHHFHLIAAELEYMLALEQEFDELLDDQVERKRFLAERLLLDPNQVSNEDLDIPDYPDLDEPPFWEN